MKCLNISHLSQNEPKNCYREEPALFFINVSLSLNFRSIIKILITLRSCEFVITGNDEQKHRDIYCYNE